MYQLISEFLKKRTSKTIQYPELKVSKSSIRILRKRLRIPKNIKRINNPIKRNDKLPTTTKRKRRLNSKT